MNKHLMKITALAVATMASASFAESDISTNTGALTATARVDFRITVPRVLFLQVGTGTLLTDVATINLIDFNVPAASIGNGTAVAATAVSGDLTNGAVTARLFGNGGPITLSSSTTGALSDGGAPASTISWSNISTAVSALGAFTSLPHPGIADTGSPANAATTGKVSNLGSTWTYSYNNTTGFYPSAGVYGGPGTTTAGVNNGRVTYTASMP